MKKTNAIMRTSFKNHFHSISLVVVGLGICVICIAVIIVAGFSFIPPNLDDMKTANSQRMGFALSVLAYASSILVMGVCNSTLYSVPAIKEKTQGNIEALFSTPTNIRQVWFGKSIALFLPGYLLGMFMSIAVVLFFNVAFIMPVHGFVLNIGLAICAFVVIPLENLCICLLLTLVGLISNPIGANVINVINTVGVISVMINIAARMTANSNIWLFLLLNIGLVVLLLVIIFLSLPKLQREKVILSCYEQ